MIYIILLLIWIIITPTLIIALKQEFKNNFILLLSQIYNFITGFFSWIIFFIPGVLIISSFKDMINIYVCIAFSGILSLILFLILLLPLNIKIKKKIDMNTIAYIILSIITIIFGFCVFFVLSNLD